MAELHLLLTFNDGPWKESTPSILRALKEWGVRAIFFISDTPDVVELARQIVADGHQLGFQGGADYLLAHKSLKKTELSAQLSQLRKKLGLENNTDHFKFARGPYSIQPDEGYPTGLTFLGSNFSWTDDARLLESKKSLELLNKKFLKEFKDKNGRLLRKEWIISDIPFVLNSEDPAVFKEMQKAWKDDVSRNPRIVDFNSNIAGWAHQIDFTSRFDQLTKGGRFVLRFRESSWMLPEMLRELLHRLVGFEGVGNNATLFAVPKDLETPPWQEPLKSLPAPPATEPERENGLHSRLWTMTSRYMGSRYGLVTNFVPVQESGVRRAQIGLLDYRDSVPDEAFWSQKEIFASPTKLKKFPQKGFLSFIVPKSTTSKQPNERIQKILELNFAEGQRLALKEPLGFSRQGCWALYLDSVLAALQVAPEPQNLGKLEPQTLPTPWSMPFSTNDSAWVRLEAIRLPDPLKLLWLDLLMTGQSGQDPIIQVSDKGRPKEGSIWALHVAHQQARLGPIVSDVLAAADKMWTSLNALGNTFDLAPPGKKNYHRKHLVHLSQMLVLLQCIDDLLETNNIQVPESLSGPFKKALQLPFAASREFAFLNPKFTLLLGRKYEREMWGKQKKLAANALNFAVRWFGLKKGLTQPGAVAEEGEELTKEDKINLLRTIRAISWVETKHTTGKAADEKQSRPDRDPMQVGDKRNPTWKVFLGTATGRSYQRNPKFTGNTVETIKSDKLRKFVQSDGAFPEAAKISDNLKPTASIDPTFTTSHSYYWGIICLIQGFGRKDIDGGKRPTYLVPTFDLQFLLEQAAKNFNASGERHLRYLRRLRASIALFGPVDEKLDDPEAT